MSVLEVDCLVVRHGKVVVDGRVEPRAVVSPFALVLTHGLTAWVVLSPLG